MIEKQIIDKTKEKGFTKFFDMHSGGEQKLQWGVIYVNLPEELAKHWFYEKFNRNCDNVTCSCCGEDYSVSSYETLEDATHFFRNELWRNQQNTDDMDFNEFYKNVYSDYLSTIPLSEYLALDNVLYVEIDRI